MKITDFVNRHALKKGINWRAKKDLKKSTVVAGVPMGNAGATGIGALVKGQEGDWQKEGYKFDLQKHPNGKDLKIESSAPNGDWAGEYSFGHHPNGKDIYVDNAKTHIDHRRKGVASEAYRLAEHHFGKKIAQLEDEQTPAAKALWANPNRKFGKSEDLTKGQNGDWKESSDYSFDHTQGDHGRHTIKVYHGRKPVGEYKFHPTEDGHMYSVWSETHPDHQRKGLATEAYRMIQEKTGKKLKPSMSQTEDGQKLWAKKDKIQKSLKLIKDLLKN